MAQERVHRDLVPKVFALVLVVVSLAVAPALAGSGNKGKGHNAAAGAEPCTFAGNVVFGTGLPTGEVINFMVTDASGTDGWVLGFTPDGTWAVDVAAPNGPTTYEFASRTYGPNGSKYDVFQSCSV